MYVWPPTSVTSSDLNTVFPSGSTITITRTPAPSKPVEDNLALSFGACARYFLPPSALIPYTFLCRVNSVYGTCAEASDPAITGAGDRNYFAGASSGGKARVRVGGTSQAFEGGRDYTEFTINWFAKIKLGYAYYNRQYVISDRFADMDAVAKTWVSVLSRRRLSLADGCLCVQGG
jgi:hypothetical protein